ncbi:MAG TPA: hypothetical protein VFE47_25690 [Tepidisphaeraceae bacterium]|nr:hypothetical protein [Tepidisphaeraceae bacterium]
MKNDKKPPKQDKQTASSVPSPVTAAAIAMMPVVYSQQIAVQQQTSGPLPSPELLQRYEQRESKQST